MTNRQIKEKIVDCYKINESAISKEQLNFIAEVIEKEQIFTDNLKEYFDKLKAGKLGQMYLKPTNFLAHFHEYFKNNLYLRYSKSEIIKDIKYIKQTKCYQVNRIIPERFERKYGIKSFDELNSLKK